MNGILGKLYRLRVSRYDNVAGLLLALLVVLGVVVLCGLIAWMTYELPEAKEPVPPEWQQIAKGKPPWGKDKDIEPPPAEETEPPDEELEKTLDAVADAVATEEAVLRSPKPPGKGKKGGPGDGTGDDDDDDGPDRGDHPRRWEVQFAEGHNLDTYARQLDFFKIELGVLMTDGKVIYAYNLSKPKPDSRTGPASTEGRYYLTWRRGELEKADCDLLTRAGIEHQGRIILKFITPELEAELVRLEKQKAGDKADRVRTTRFGILPDGNGFKFHVKKQTYRRPVKKE